MGPWGNCRDLGSPFLLRKSCRCCGAGTQGHTEILFVGGCSRVPPLGSPKMEQGQQSPPVEGPRLGESRLYCLHPPRWGQGRGNPGPATPDKEPWALLRDSVSPLVKGTEYCL